MNVMNKFSLKEKCTIITGAAMGLGKAMALAMADMGSNIVIADMNEEVANQTAEELRAKGVEVLVSKVNVTNVEDIKRCIKATKEKFGKIDVLVNNAGIVKHANAEEVEYKDWSAVIDVNLTGVFLMAQEVAKVMIAQKQGNIINISSMSGSIVNFPQKQASYNASKAGVIHLTKSLAVEWAEHNIRVNTIAPGYMKTDLTKKFFEAEENKELIKTWMSGTPMNRAGEPDELGGVVVFLASDASSFITGSSIVVDGGYTAL